MLEDKPTGGTGSKHFNVEFLLILTTGWHLGHISSLVRRKEEDVETEEKMLKEIDDNHCGVHASRPVETQNDYNGKQEARTVKGGSREGGLRRRRALQSFK